MATQITLPPFTIEVDGVPVTILEASKQTLYGGKQSYIVSIYITYKGIRSKIFPLFCENEKDMLNKIKAEITKIKFMELAYGIEEVKKVIT